MARKMKKPMGRKMPMKKEAMMDRPKESTKEKGARMKRLEGKPV